MRRLWVTLTLLVTILLFILTCRKYCKCRHCGKWCRCMKCSKCGKCNKCCKCKKCDGDTGEPLSLRELSECLIDAFDREDMQAVASHVDPEAGLLFSPYVYVADDAVVFPKSEVANLLGSNQTYIWGTRDGSGETIELTPSEYFAEFLDMSRYQNPDEVTENEIGERGSMINNIRDKFPHAEFIEFYSAGTAEYSEMDWSSLYLVYNRNERGYLKLIAIVRDVWTI